MTNLTHPQLVEAITQMGVSCDLALDDGYRLVSARSVLNDLGYGEHMDQILGAIAANGFDYCLDSHIACSSGVGSDDPARKEYPDQGVCWWGPDQLKSRLMCLRNGLSDGMRRREHTR